MPVPPTPMKWIFTGAPPNSDLASPRVLGSRNRRAACRSDATDSTCGDVGPSGCSQPYCAGLPRRQDSITGAMRLTRRARREGGSLLRVPHDAGHPPRPSLHAISIASRVGPLLARRARHPDPRPPYPTRPTSRATSAPPTHFRESRPTHGASGRRWGPLETGRTSTRRHAMRARLLI